MGANSEAVADYALALMLGVARKVALIDRRCRERDWSKITGIDLYGKTVGIIGLGAIGKRVARRCGAGFGMKVLGHDIVWDDAWASENHVERADLERIFREADFISLHTSLDDSTRHLVDAPRLALMKPTAILINTARGELVDGPALLEALEQKRIYGAGHCKGQILNGRVCAVFFAQMRYFDHSKRSFIRLIQCWYILDGKCVKIETILW